MEHGRSHLFWDYGFVGDSVIIKTRSLAENRDSDGLGYLRQVVSQFLVLMDGVSDRGRVLIIATTNCLDHIDSAILRPGCIDRKIFMCLPDKQGSVMGKAFKPNVG